MKESESAGILVVEDDPIIAMHVEDVLTGLGFREIRIAYDLANGLAMVSARAPALAILDVNIGEDIVFPLAAMLRERRIPFIFSTGSTKDDLPTEWASQPVLPKPLSPKALAAALAALGMQ